MATDLKNFNPTLKQTQQSVECLPLCMKAMSGHLGIEEKLAPIIAAWQKDKYGYDLFEALTTIASVDDLAEFGLYDLDYLPAGQQSYDLSILRAVRKDSKQRPEHVKQSLDSMINFIERFPDLTKIQPNSLVTIEAWLRQGKPVGVTVGIAEFMEIDSEEIHAVVVYGLKQQEVSVWDPVIGFVAVPAEHFLAAWRAVGSYYFVLK